MIKLQCPQTNKPVWGKKKKEILDGTDLSSLDFVDITKYHLSKNMESNRSLSRDTWRNRQTASLSLPD